MLSMLLGFSLQLENLQVTFDVQGISSSGEKLFQKTITLQKKQQILDFMKDYVNKNWNPIFECLQVQHYKNQVIRLEVVNLKFGVQ